MNEIINWLDNPVDYIAGVTLYERYGHSASLKRILRKGGESKRNRGSLIYELAKLVRNLTVSAPQPPAPQPVKQIQPAPGPRPRIISKELKAMDTPAPRPPVPESGRLKEYARDLMKEREALFYTLEQSAEKERARKSHRILDIGEELDDIFKRLEHFEKHGILPPATSPAKEESKKTTEMSPVDLIKHQMKLRTYVSRYKRLVEQSKKPETLSKNRDLLERYTTELNEVNQKLMQ